MLIAGTLPGVIAGSVIRVKLLTGPHVFDALVAAVLIPLGIRLVLSRPARPDTPNPKAWMIPDPALMILAFAVGCVGRIYGLGLGCSGHGVPSGAGLLSCSSGRRLVAEPVH